MVGHSPCLPHRSLYQVQGTCLHVACTECKRHLWQPDTRRQLETLSMTPVPSVSSSQAHSSQALCRVAIEPLPWNPCLVHTTLHSDHPHNLPQPDCQCSRSLSCAGDEWNAVTPSPISVSRVSRHSYETSLAALSTHADPLNSVSLHFRPLSSISSVSISHVSVVSVIPSPPSQSWR